ncbi:MAG: TetR family transcriptional regulator [Lachnospiraceae bacterium]|jgi:AcrR family transcriptional regulator|nr:TetR family transcriptional regulator [Lachnospiraceae bacterium]
MDGILSGLGEGKAEGAFGRQENTRYKLADSVKRCMKYTPVDRITVKDIAEGCGLTRQTFYRNFKDKYDLINWYFDKLVQQSLGQIETGSRVGESLARKLAFIQEEKAFFCGAFRSDDHNSLKEHDFELILQFYHQLLDRRASKPLDEELQFQLEMYCRGSVYMTVKWVLGGMKDTPQQMSDKLVDAMPPRLARVFDELGLL